MESIKKIMVVNVEASIVYAYEIDFIAIICVIRVDAKECHKNNLS